MIKKFNVYIWRCQVEKKTYRRSKSQDIHEFHEMKNIEMLIINEKSI